MSDVTITSRGAGYTTPPAVTFSAPEDPKGTRATGTALIANGTVTGIRIDNGGSGYSNPPNVVIDAPPAVPAGQPNATPIAPAGARAVVKGTIVSIAVPDGGFGYTTAPRVTIRGGNGDASATAVVKDGVVTAITVDKGGTGYTFDANTTITIDPPPVVANPDVATAEAIVGDDGRITGYIVGNPGSGYGAVPTVTVEAPLSAVGTVAVTALTDENGVVSSVVAQGAPVVMVTTGGSGYIAATTTVTLAPPATAGGRAAKATPVIVNGQIVDIQITDPGSGYALGETPTVTISGAGAGASASAYVATGYGYRADPRVVISPPPASSLGTQAQATAVRDPEGRITGFVIGNGGSGYDPMAKLSVLVALPEPTAAKAEQVALNAALSAASYTINVADDPMTDRPRGKLFVSQTSSMGADFGGTKSSSTISVTADTSDVLVEGRVFGTNQTWFMPSAASAQDLLTCPP